MGAVKPGTLFLLPAPLQSYGPKAWEPVLLAQSIPAGVLRLFGTLDCFIVESEKSALRLLSRFKDKEAMDRLSLKVLDEHSGEGDLPLLLEDILEGRDCGFFTEAGMPGIADPGGALVAYARRRGVAIQALAGPSSVFLALSASGLDAQRFAFLGYLPAERQVRRQAIRRLAAEFKKDGMTRVFIETPYRNAALLADLSALLPDELWLCVAYELCGADEKIFCRPAALWRKEPLPTVAKAPAVFLFGNQAALKPVNTR